MAVMNDPGLYRALIYYLSSTDKNRILTELITAIEMESGEFWPSSKQHLIERLQETFFDNLSKTDEDYEKHVVDKIRTSVATFPNKRLVDLADFINCMDKLTQHDQPKARDYDSYHRVDSGNTGRSDESISLLLGAMTEEQSQIVENIGRNEESLELQGFAGCGKTTVIEMAYYSDPLAAKGTWYTAFNKGIVKAVKNRIPSMTTKTFDSIGYRLGLENSPWESDHIGIGRVQYLKISEVIGVKPSHVLSGYENIKGNRVSRLAYSIVESYCNSGCQEINDSLVPVEIASPEARAELLHYAKNLWGNMIATPDIFDHQVIRPSFVTKAFSLQNGKLPGYVRRLFLDEAQDVNGAFAAILDNSNHVQVIAAGDRYQELYGWRGAVNAMSRWGANRLAVTKSFRFGEPIAELANATLALVSNQPDEVISSYSKGIASEIVGYQGSPGKCDVILARSRASVFALAKGLANKNRSFFLNLDVEEWRSMLRSALALRRGENTNQFNHRTINLFDHWSQLVSYAEAALDSDLTMCVKIVNEHYETLEEDLAQIARRNTSYEHDADVILSTTHKIKGRDWDNVALAEDFLYALNRIECDRDTLDKELNILYVALTRARKTLQVPYSLLEWLNSCQHRSV